MIYNTKTSRDDAAEVPAEIVQQIMGNIETESSVLRAGATKISTSKRDSRIPVLKEAPSAYWVAGDYGRKQTSKAVWEAEPLYAEEIAVLIPVGDNILSDDSYGLFDTLKPLVARAFAKVIDDAILWGINKPSSWSSPSLVQAAFGAGHYVPADASDPVVSLLSAAEKLAEKSVNPTGALVRPGYQFRLAARHGANAFQGGPVGKGNAFPLVVAGLPLTTNPGTWAYPELAECVVADFSQVLIGMRQDMRWDASNSGVIVDDDGKVVMTAFQEDTTIFRFVARLGYALAETPNADGENVTPVSLVTGSPAYAS